MIGRLTGTLAHKQPPQLLLDVQGVGYEVEAPMSTFYQLPETGARVVLHTHLVVREDAHILFGFATESERALFRQLIRVNGVGAKLALAILSSISADDLSRVVQEQDVTALCRVPGIGKKTAERLLVELKDRLTVGVDAARLPGGALASTPRSSRSEAQEALVALGYKPQEAERLVRNAGADLTTEEIIRQALQGIAAKK